MTNQFYSAAAVVVVAIAVFVVLLSRQINLGKVDEQQEPPELVKVALEWASSNKWSLVAD